MTMPHAPDCSAHNGPGDMPGFCDCRAGEASGGGLRAWVRGLLNLPSPLDERILELEDRVAELERREAVAEILQMMNSADVRVVPHYGKVS